MDNCALLVMDLRGRYPAERFAVSKSGAAIGHFHSQLGRFYPVYMKAITGDWVWTAEQEIHVNGRPPYAPDDWVEAA